MHIPQKVIICSKKILKSTYVLGFHGFLPCSLENGRIDIDRKFKLEIQNFDGHSKIFLYRQRSQRLIRSILVDFKGKQVKSSHYLGYTNQGNDYIVFIRLFLEFQNIMTQSHYLMVSLLTRAITRTTIFEEGSTQDIPALFNGTMSADQKHLFVWDHKNTIQMIRYNYEGEDMEVVDSINVPQMCKLINLLTYPSQI